MNLETLFSKKGNTFEYLLQNYNIKGKGFTKKISFALSCKKNLKRLRENTNEKNSYNIDASIAFCNANDLLC